MLSPHLPLSLSIGLKRLHIEHVGLEPMASAGKPLETPFRKPLKPLLDIYLYVPVDRGGEVGSGG
jgi:hypothetical protein